MKRHLVSVLLASAAVALTFWTPCAHAQRHTPPPPPQVAPLIAERYPEDRDGDRIADDLQGKAAAAKEPADLQQWVDVELVFAEPITQEQIDAFEKQGGEITYVYRTLSYGWNGRVPLGKVPALPQLPGGTLVLVKEPGQVRATLDKATRNGRARQVWVSGAPFHGNRGSTNITIGIIDSGVDTSHTDLTNRCVYWKDFSSDGATSPRDYFQHGTHVAGIALGTGAAGGTNNGFLYTSQVGNLYGIAGYYAAPFDLPQGTNSRFNLVAKWTGGGSASLFAGSRTKNTTGLYGESWGNSGLSPRTLSDGPIFTGSDNTQFTFALKNNGSTGVSDYVVYGSISNYPAVGDGFARMSGVAPVCNYAAAKVFTDAGVSLTSWVESALDDFVTRRTTHKIKVINLSMEAAEVTNTTYRQKVNTAVNNGVVVIVAAGNSGESGEPVHDPGRAALAITVGAVNDTNQLTEYTSLGFTNPGSGSGQEEDYKPDILAPGGSDRYTHILSADSGTGDRLSFSDQQANDYAPMQGTSMAAPFVSGAAALIINAMEQSGTTWNFNSSAHPRFVKMLLCATASESNQNREGGTNNPTLQRTASGPNSFPAGKDQYEGYGMINVDAAVQAVRDSLPSTSGFSTNITLGSSNNLASDKRVWAAKVDLAADYPKLFTLLRPSTGLFDLYLYSTNSGAYGTPIILRSVEASATNSMTFFSYAPSNAETALVVLKRVSGYGEATLLVNSADNDYFTNAAPIYNSSGSASDSLGNGFSSNSAETGEPKHQGYGPTCSAWWKWTAPAHGAATFTATSSQFTPCMGVYTGTNVASLTRASTLATNILGQIVFHATNGTTYRIAVDLAAFSGLPWDYSITWSVNRSPTLSSISTLTGATEDTAFTISYAALAAAADEADADSSSISFRVEGIMSGTLTKNGTNVAAGSTLLSANENWVWTPATNANGTIAGFTVRAFDGATASTNAVQVNVNVTAVNDAPTLSSISTLAGATEDTPLTISHTTLANAADEADVDSASISFRIESVTSGTLTKNGSQVVAGSTLLSSGEALVWTPATNVSGSAVAAFTVRAWDGALASSASAQVNVNVAPVNDAPTLTAITNLTGALEDTAFTVSYATLATNSNIADVDTAAAGLSFRVEGVTSGTLRKNGTNVVAGSTLLSTNENWVWTPATNANGALAAFTVRAWDGSLASAAAVQVAVNVAAVNDRPVVANPVPTQAATYGSFFSYTFPTNTFTDVDSGTLSYSLRFLEGYPYASWVSLDSATRTLSGTPSSSGTQGVELQADDGSSGYAYTPVEIVIARAPLTVTPSNVTRAYGQTNPVLSGTLTGVVNGDNITATYSTTATTESPPGTYPITAMLVDPANRQTNYNITLNQSTLTINALPTVTLISPATNDLLRAGFAMDLIASASDSDGEIVKVEFLVNGAALGEKTSSPYILAWTNTAAGTFSLMARATDSAGGTSTSPVVPVTVHPYLHLLRYSAPQFQMRFYGVPGVNYDLRFSTDLTTWNGLTNFWGVSGGNVILDSGASGTGRFYGVWED